MKNTTGNFKTSKSLQYLDFSYLEKKPTKNICMTPENSNISTSLAFLTYFKLAKVNIIDDANEVPMSAGI